MNKKILICIIFLILPLTGCWDYSEISEFSVVAGMAIDKGEEKKYKISVEAVKLETTKDIKIDSIIYESEGDTIFEAFRNAIKLSGRKLYLGHCRIVIISEELAKEGIYNILDFFIRDYEPRITMRIVISKGEDAKAILKSEKVYSEILAYEMETMLEQNVYLSGFSKEIKIFRIINDIITIGKDLVLPAFILDTYGEEDKETFVIYGLAAFKDDKLVGYIDLEHSRYHASLTNWYQGSGYSFDFGEKGYLGIDIHGSSTKRKVEYVDGVVHLYFDVFKEISVTENNTIDENGKQIRFTEEDVKYIVAKDCVDKVEVLLKQIREEFDSDILGIERLVYATKHRVWKEIKDDYDFLNDAQIHMTIKVEIRSFGQFDPKGW